MLESKVIMFCPKCKVLMQTDTETCDIQQLEMYDPELAAINQVKFENCDCNEDFIYLDDFDIVKVI